MPVALAAMSHSPLLGRVDPGPDTTSAVESAFDSVRRFVKDFDPDLIVCFSPDHYNGFFYDLMPPFCVGYNAVSIGDYGSQAGPLDVPADTSRALAEYVLEQGVDLAVSLRMEIDHGAVQPLEIVYESISAKPVIPVFVNSVAPPFVPLARVRALGAAIGRYFANTEQRVLFLASGGLSHDPPVPRLATASAEQREALLGGGRHLSPGARDERERRVIRAAHDFVAGKADIKELAPEWDEQFLDIVAGGDLSSLDSWSPQWMTDVAGNSSHEIRTWVAAYAALAAVGEYRVDFRFYRPIKEFLAGFAVTTAVLE
ncbi:3-(2,3-dihydroxyphenyl)propionate dioxygenase [Prescottella equi]|uniref:3-carboxyethylcatechol 2,3-dioxygenase n=1 Tax=Rhodococcus hoagii TaxID=43767 RepID=UPI000A11C4DD|nr:3-carboxyethylcatechol 2,3-dioxygenase [Prescottella equi]ORJ97460.1 3-(2,3-dihydroxyphenyl)propionate dioxygenase [Prescottella equi]